MKEYGYVVSVALSMRAPSTKNSTRFTNALLPVGCGVAVAWTTTDDPNGTIVLSVGATMAVPVAK